MNRNLLITNLIAAFCAQGIAYLLGIANSLILPKVLNVESFGYWQLFCFYTSYVGVCGFGLGEGIYLLYGGMRPKDIDDSKIKSQLVLGIVLQIVITALALLLCNVITVDAMRKSVLVFTALYITPYFINWYLGYLFQAINQTNIFSKSLIISKALFFAGMTALMFLRADQINLYMTVHLLSQCFASGYCLIKARFVLTAGMQPIKLTLCSAKASMTVGLKLLVANYAEMLILGVARMAIDGGWDAITFGQVSLALSVSSMFSQFVTQVSMVIFPALRQVNRQTLRAIFPIARDGLGTLFPVVYVFYFLISFLLGIWLPDYTLLREVLAYVFPICVFDSKMNIICSTYMKVLREEKALLKINLVTLGVSASGALFFALLMHNLHAVVLWMTGVTVLRSIISEHYVGARLDISPSRVWKIELVVTLLFIVSVVFLTWQVAMMVTIAAYLTQLFLCQDIVRIIVNIINERRDNEISN